MPTKPPPGAKQTLIESAVANRPSRAHRQTLGETEEFETCVNWAPSASKPVGQQTKTMLEGINSQIVEYVGLNELMIIMAQEGRHLGQ